MFARLLHPVRTEERAEGCAPLANRTLPRIMCGRESEPRTGVCHADTTLRAIWRLESSRAGTVLHVARSQAAASSIAVQPVRSRTGYGDVSPRRSVAICRRSGRPSDEMPTSPVIVGQMEVLRTCPAERKCRRAERRRRQSKPDLHRRPSLPNAQHHLPAEAGEAAGAGQVDVLVGRGEFRY